MIRFVVATIRRRLDAFRRGAAPPQAIAAKSDQWHGYYATHIRYARRDGVSAAAILDDRWSDGRAPAEIILPYVSADSVILEIACGVGRVSRFVAPRCGRLYCTDILPEALNEAKATLAEFDNVSFELTNGYDLRQFGDGMFDAVYSFTSFFHFDLELVLNYFDEITRVLKPGGIALLQFKKLSHKSDLDQLLAKIANHGGIATYEAMLDKWRYVSLEMLQVMCEHFGLEIVNDDVSRFTVRKPAVRLR